MTQPQKAGMWEKEQTRLEEALAQGTTITGVKGPREVLAAGRCPQSRSWKTTALWQSRHIRELKTKKIRKETSLRPQNQIKLLKTYKQITLDRLGVWWGLKSVE